MQPDRFTPFQTKTTPCRKTSTLLLALVLIFSSEVLVQDHYQSFNGTDDYIAPPIPYNGTSAVPVVSVEAWVRTGFSGSGYNSNCAIVDFDRSDFYVPFVRGDDGRVAKALTLLT